MINTQGIFRYRPNWWAWIEVDYELGRYLRRSFLFGHGIKLQKPSWNEHITCVSTHEKEKISHPELWGKHEGITINFSIQTEALYYNGNAYWYDVVSNEVDNIRLELGLKNPREIPLHFAIGYLTNGKIGV